MFKFIEEEYPIFKSIYEDIYNKKNSKYFEELSEEIDKYCKENSIVYKISMPAHKLLLDK